MVLCYLFLFIILVISRFGFEGWSWFLIASVPDLCILFTFILLISVNIVQILDTDIQRQRKFVIISFPADMSPLPTVIFQLPIYILLNNSETLADSLIIFHI